jgi:alpha-ketoglutaric semialdehyde dehydrogenase
MQEERSLRGNYINGEWMMARGGRTVPNRNPARTDMILGDFPDSTAADVADAVVAANSAFPAWRALPMTRRGEILHRAAGMISLRANEIAEAITYEQGKTLREAHEEVAWSASLLRYYASAALQPEGELFPPAQPGMLLYTRREPLGAIGVLTPWTFPFAIPIWKIAPALVYGNTVVLKPAELTPLSAALLTSIMAEAGLPPGALNLIQGRGSVVGEAIVGHQQLAAISFTGSNAVGYGIKRRLIDRHARVQLELGGKNPMIVLRDADIGMAVEWTISGAMRMAGQKCTATSRVIVEEPVLDAFTARLVERTRLLRVGDGIHPDTYVGPVVSEAQQAKILDYLHVGINEGAQILTGGDALEHDGYEDGFYVAPTVFANVKPTMRIMQEEIFGPVIAIIGARDVEQAIAIANGVPNGLSASIVTRDVGAALHYVEAIAARTVHVNREPSSLDFYAPFSGRRSASSDASEAGKGTRDFYTETKTIYLQGLSE